MPLSVRRGVNAPRDPPDGMNRLVESVSLNYQHTGSLRVFRIILYDGGSEDSIHDYPCGKPVFYELIVSVFGNTHVTFLYQGLDHCQSSAQAVIRRSPALC